MHACMHACKLLCKQVEAEGPLSYIKKQNVEFVVVNRAVAVVVLLCMHRQLHAASLRHLIADGASFV